MPSGGSRRNGSISCKFIRYIQACLFKYGINEIFAQYSIVLEVDKIDNSLIPKITYWTGRIPLEIASNFTSAFRDAMTHIMDTYRTTSSCVTA